MDTRNYAASSSPYDIIIIGAGHNGLVCATYLAKVGLKTLMIEQQDVVGGACITKPLFPECKVSAAACWYGMLRPRIIRDLNLYKYGLEPYVMDPQLLMLYPDGRHLFIWLDDAKTDLEVAKFAPAYASTDVTGLHEFSKYTDNVLEIISPLFLHPPLSIEEIAQKFIDKGYPYMHDEVFKYSVAEMVSKFVMNDELRAALAFGATSISNTSPFTPKTAFDLFYMLAAETQGYKKAWGFIRGGMGSITTALEKAAISVGVEIWTSCEVNRILIERDTAVGVALNDGSEILARTIVSNADPKRTFLHLLPSSCLSEPFREQVDRFQISGSSSILHLLLGELPRFQGFKNEGSGDQHRGMIVIAPSLQYLHNAWHDATNGKISDHPVLTMSMQSVTDKSLTPAGKHVLSIFIQFTPYNLARGNWDDAKQALVQGVLNTIEHYAPNIKDILLDYVVFTPLDIERSFGITGGHTEHGDMILDQLFENRPILHWANYSTPIQNLYLCGSGTHPGGTVTGAPGFNAAHAILKGLKH